MAAFDSITDYATLNTAIADGNAGGTTGEFANSVTETGAPTTITATAAGSFVLDGNSVDNPTSFTLTGDGAAAALRVGTGASGVTTTANAMVTIDNLNIANTGTGAAINVGTGGVVTFSDDGTGTMSTISAPIAGNGGVALALNAAANGGDGSAPTVVFGGVNTYTGQTTIGAAADITNDNPLSTLILGPNSSIALSAAVVDNGVLDVSSVQTTAGAATSVAIQNLQGAGSVSIGFNTLTVTESVANTGAAGTFSGDISSATPGGGATGGLTLASGSLTLSGSNDYEGSTRIAPGTATGAATLALTGAASIADSANVSIKAGGTLDISGETTVPGGETVFINQLNGQVGGSIVLGTNGLVINEDVTGATFAGTITGTGGIFVEGGNTLTLSGANSYSGGTTIEPAIDGNAAGSLALAPGGTIGTGTLDDEAAFNISALTSGSLAISELLGGTTTATLVLGSNELIVAGSTGPTGGASVSDFAGVISGAGGIQVGAPATAAAAVDTSTLTLSGVNTFMGSTRIYGDLALTGAGSIADSANVALKAAGAELDVSGATGVAANINGASVLATSINQLTGQPGSTIALGAKNLIVNESGAGTFEGAITGTGEFVVRGAGTLTLDEIATGGTGPAPFTGTVVVGGHLSIASTTELTDAGVAVNGGHVDISTALATTAGASTTAVDIGSLTGTSTGSVTLGANTLMIEAGGGQHTFAGVISGSGGVTNAGYETFTGANTYSGVTTNSGELFISGAGSIANTSAIVNSALLEFENTTGTITANIANTGTVEFVGTAETVSGVISGANGSLSVGDGFTGIAPTAGSLTLTGADTYTGETEILGQNGAVATLTIGAGGSIAGSFEVFLDGNAAFNVSQAGGTQSIHELLTPGAGTTGATANTVSLGATNLLITGVTGAVAAPTTAGASETFSGVISGTTGQLQIGVHAGLNIEAAQAYTGSTVIYGSLFLTGAGSVADSANVSLKATTGATTGDGLLDISGVTTGATIHILTGQFGTHINLGAETLTIDETSAGTYAGIIEGGGALDVAGGSASSPTYLTLDGANSDTGLLTITGALALGTTTGTSVAGSIANSGVVDNGFFAIGADSTINDLSGTGVVKTMGHMLTVTENADTIFSGVIHGTGGILTLAGDNTLTLSGSSDFTGGVHLTGDGYLHLTALNAAGTGAITFEAGNDVYLELDNGALTGAGTTTESFANVINLNANGGLIDLTGLAFNSSATTAAQTFTVGTDGTAGDLTITEGAVSVTFHTDLSSTTTVTAMADGSGGTYFQTMGAGGPTAGIAHDASLHHP